MKKGVTFLEIIVVIIIVGVLATLAVSHYGVTKEKALGKEAVSQLKILQTAERVRRLEFGNYVVCANTIACNGNLNLDLPAANWAYKVESGNVQTIFTTTATRLSGSWINCTFTIDQDDLEPATANGCQQ